uniref:Uncharacterized protein n=1 Tax=Anopheles farauti TaxID=69004 RepID=A0A182Q063_9DIPT
MHTSNNRIVVSFITNDLIVDGCARSAEELLEETHSHSAPFDLSVPSLCGQQTRDERDGILTPFDADHVCSACEASPGSSGKSVPDAAETKSGAASCRTSGLESGFFEIGAVPSVEPAISTAPGEKRPIGAAVPGPGEPFGSTERLDRLHRAKATIYVQTVPVVFAVDSPRDRLVVERRRVRNRGSQFSDRGGVRDGLGGDRGGVRDGLGYRSGVSEGGLSNDLGGDRGSSNDLGGQRLTVDDSVESVVRVSGVFDGTLGAIRINDGVRSLDNISAARLLLGLGVTGQGVGDSVRERVLRVGIVLFRLGGVRHLSDRSSSIGDLSHWSRSNDGRGSRVRHSRRRDQASAGHGDQSGEGHELREARQSLLVKRFSRNRSDWLPRTLP